MKYMTNSLYLSAVANDTNFLFDCDQQQQAVKLNLLPNLLSSETKKYLHQSLVKPYIKPNSKRQLHTTTDNDTRTKQKMFKLRYMQFDCLMKFKNTNSFSKII